MYKIRQDLNMGTNLRKLRKDCGFTQEKTAVKMQLLGCEIDRSLYSRYETGELNIRISDLVALKQIFKCNYDDFFEGFKIEYQPMD
ncbi:MAG: helix-turn-helix domain-containing protein [Oscillospiraceae bacterium]|nr:helix-turn-helix domain-containing protein [Oscillospiraceae bacterium]